MNSGLIAARYARALYEVAASVKEETVVRQELELVLTHLHNFPELSATLASPIVSSAEKERLLRTAAGNQPSDSLSRFFRLLLKRHREALLSLISQRYLDVYEQKKGILKVTLTTAVPVDKGRQEYIRKQLEQSSGKQIELISVVKPEIVGGYVLSTGQKRLDVSVTGLLNRYRQQLTL
jgi:F-type H+-transporting ATPase subunit delta